MNELGYRTSSKVWQLFSYVNFAIAAAMMAGGIYNLQASFAAKGFYAMAALMLISSTVAITNALGDKEDAQQLHNQLDEARTEKLLKEMSDEE